MKNTKSFDDAMERIKSSGCGRMTIRIDVAGQHGETPALVRWQGDPNEYQTHQLYRILVKRIMTAAKAYDGDWEN